MSPRGVLRAIAFSLVLAAAVVTGATLPAGAASALAMGAATGQAPVARNCTSSVYGELGDDWMPSSVVVGPLAFVRARAYSLSTSSFASIGGGRYRGSKLLVAVRTGWVVRLVVPTADRRTVALQYAPADFNKAVVPARSEHDVIFTACPPGRPFLGPATALWTQFNGAIVVAGRRCVTLAVYAARQGHRLPRKPRLARLSFGAGACRS
jgi:hypothetical protein